MATRKGLVSYDGLPISSGGAHGLRNAGPLEAWNSLQSFLSDCTTASGPTQVSLHINDLPEVDRTTLARLNATLRAQLESYLEFESRDELGDRGATDCWTVAPAGAEAAVRWLDAAGPLEDNWLAGPASLMICFEFRFKGSTGVELPFQSNDYYLGQAYNGYGLMLGNSVCQLTLSASSKLSLVIFLPFEEPDIECMEFATFLRHHSPIEFSELHWKHWKLNKKGDRYVGRRIGSPLL